MFDNNMSTRVFGVAILPPTTRTKWEDAHCSGVPGGFTKAKRVCALERWLFACMGRRLALSRDEPAISNRHHLFFFTITCCGSAHRVHCSLPASGRRVRLPLPLFLTSFFLYALSCASAPRHQHSRLTAHAAPLES